MARIARFLDDERGATAIEYGLVTSLVVLVIISAISSIGASVLGFFAAVAKGFG